MLHQAHSTLHHQEDTCINVILYVKYVNKRLYITFSNIFENAGRAEAGRAETGL